MISLLPFIDVWVAKLPLDFVPLDFLSTFTKLERLRSLKENIEKEHQYPANAYECLSCIPHSGHANDNTRRKFRSGHAKVAYACFQIRNTFSYFPSHLTATPNHVLAIIWSIATLPWTFRTCPLFLSCGSYTQQQQQQPGP